MTADTLAALGREFRRLGMHRHAEQLGAFYLAQRDGRDAEWSPDFVEGWAKRLRVPPYEEAMELRPPGSRCDGSPDTSRPWGVMTKYVWPGGCEAWCSSCGRAWLELQTQ